MQGNVVEIKIALVRYGVRQYEVARALGVSEYTLSRWLHTDLSPERKETILETIRRIAKG